jgi:hypothetical protein
MGYSVKPLAIFSGVVVVGLAVIAAGLRLTSHPASARPTPVTPVPSLTHAQFVRAANRVCRREMRAAKAKGLRHPKITNLRTLTRDYRLAVPLFESEAAGVRVLRPPRRDAPTFGRLVSTLGVALRNAHGILHALQTRQVRQAFALSRRQDRLDHHLNALSRKLGLTVCATS